MFFGCINKDSGIFNDCNRSGMNTLRRLAKVSFGEQLKGKNRKKKHAIGL